MVGGSHQRWSRHGRLLLYMHAIDLTMSVVPAGRGHRGRDQPWGEFATPDQHFWESGFHSSPVRPVRPFERGEKKAIRHFSHRRLSDYRTCRQLVAHRTGYS